MRPNRRTSLLVDIRPGEVLRFDQAGIEVSMVHKSGRLVRLRVVAPAEQGIRHEHGPQLGEQGIDDRTVPALLGSL